MKSSTIHNFLLGFSNVFGTNYQKRPLSKRVIQTDEEAIKSDWEAVGNDLRYAMNKFQKEYENGN